MQTLIFDDQKPAMGDSGFGGNFGGMCVPEIKNEPGYSLLFQRLFGYTARTPDSANIECIEHESLPYYTASDLSDWRPVTLTDGKNAPQMYDSADAAHDDHDGLALTARELLHDAGLHGDLPDERQQPAPRDGESDPAESRSGRHSRAKTRSPPVSTVGLSPDHSPARTPSATAATRSSIR